MSQHAERLPAGLPTTPLERLQALALGIVVTGLLDDDSDLVVGPDSDWFAALCRVIGLTALQTLELQLLYCADMIDLDAFHPKTLHAARFPHGDPRAEPGAHWQAWPAAEARTLGR